MSAKARQRYGKLYLMLCDHTAFNDSDKPQIVGTSVSISKLVEKDNVISLSFDGTEGVTAYIRLHVPTI